VSRLAPWLLLAGVLAVVGCGGCASTSVLAATWSLDGSRAWWTADARAVMVGLVGAGITAVVVLVVGAAGAVLIQRPWVEVPPPAAVQ
jgi:hypothetical protein